MVDARGNLTDPKMLIIAAVMLMLGLGGMEFAVSNFAVSGLGIAAIIGIVLNAILNSKSLKKA